MTIFDALGSWFIRSRGPLKSSVLLLTCGTYLASSQDPKSTFFCSAHDRRALVISLQWLGLLLNAAIAILMWRILAWTRTTKGRLRSLSAILLASALGTGLLYWSSRLVLPSQPMHYHFRGLDSLYFFDVVIDGLVFSSFVISTALLTTEGSPLFLVGVITFVSGLILAAYQTLRTGTWENISPSTTYFSLLLLALGFTFFVYANNIRAVLFLHRAFIVFLLVILAITASIYTPVKAHQYLDRHSLEKIIYDARVGADRWMVHATVSDSLSVATQEYRERHNGRDPPPKFDIWYNFAKDRHSVIIDHFPQMEKDILPFWGISPAKIRDDVRRAAVKPDIAMLQLKGGKAHHNLPPLNPYRGVMDGLVSLVEGFSEHLPDMELAVNMDERPRVLAPWDDIQRFTRTANRGRVSKLLPRDADTLGEMPLAQAAIGGKSLGNPDFTPVRALREMTALACPPGTKARAGTHWDIRDLCISCVKPQSLGQFLRDWPRSQEICHQSDLLRLHSFHMTPPEQRPLQELLPIFSRAKTDGYSDILIPLGRVSEAAKPPSDAFGMKEKKLFWRGKVDRLSSDHEVIRGGHQERFVHTVNSAGPSDQARLLITKTGSGWHTVQVPTADLNAILPMDVGFTSYSACQAASDSNCDTVGKEAGTKPDAEPLRNQYVMVMDTDNGPSRDFLRTLRSGSVPFYGSIFKEWYSERILSWVHFVPVDLRFHALHSTLAYFVGLAKREDAKWNRKLVPLPGRQEDGKWIADQGQRWADKALRKEDMEVYLFRLLLEWGRVVDDRRDELGFVLAR